MSRGIGREGRVWGVRVGVRVTEGGGRQWWRDRGRGLRGKLKEEGKTNERGRENKRRK